MFMTFDLKHKHQTLDNDTVIDKNVLKVFENQKVFKN